MCVVCDAWCGWILMRESDLSFMVTWGCWFDSSLSWVKRVTYMEKQTLFCSKSVF